MRPLNATVVPLKPLAVPTVSVPELPATTLIGFVNVRLGGSAAVRYLDVGRGVESRGTGS